MVQLLFIYELYMENMMHEKEPPGSPDGPERCREQAAQDGAFPA